MLKVLFDRYITSYMVADTWPKTKKKIKEKDSDHSTVPYLAYYIS